MALRYLTAGESHGPELNIILEGIPANMPLLAAEIDAELRRRQAGYGRGGRMKIERDQVFFTGGIRHGRTFGGAPIGMKILNRDHDKWQHAMSAAPVDLNDEEVQNQLQEKFISRVRPGHADLAGTIKYNAPDVRDILERSSARETTSRVAAGAVAKKLLSLFGIQIFSHVLRIGEVEAGESMDLSALALSEFIAKVESSDFRIYDAEKTSDKETSREKKLKKYVDEIRKAGDTVGGLIEVFAVGVPIGLGSHTQWDARIDAKIAAALMSTHTVKSVEFGMGRGVSENPGSAVHDQIYINPDYTVIPDSIDKADFFTTTSLGILDSTTESVGRYFRYTRKTNNLGGIEGGMTNGMPIACTVAVKPIPTLVTALDSIDLMTQSPSPSHFERSDVCVVPAAGVVLEAMMALSIAEAFLAKFGGDSMHELATNYFSYLRQVNLK